MSQLSESIKLNFQKIYVEAGAEVFPLTEKIIEKIPHAEVIFLRQKEDFRKTLSPTLPHHTLIDQSKKTLLLSRAKGRSVKRCPGTKGLICCNYYIVNQIANCPLECSYCVLQGYINSPFITIHVNIDKILREIQSLLKRRFPSYIRIGSGELSDSLALDDLTGFSKTLVPFFAQQPNGFLELKTKTDQIENLLDLDHKGKTVIAWSLNPPSVVKAEEPFTSPLEKRLTAAAECQKAGYPLAIHLDPILYQENWEQEYQKLLEQIFTHVRPERIAWISLGGFRFPGNLKEVIHQRFPRSKIIYGELVPGIDGKYRYFKTIRQDIYRKMISWLKTYSSEQMIYFCMENPEIWEKILGWKPKSSRELDEHLSKRLIAMLN